MCVIFLADSTRPTPDQVAAAYEANDHGAGIAWRSVKKIKDKGDGVVEEKVVMFEKGLDLEAIQKRVAEVPMPFVAHFRIQSCGGLYPDLCHPFPIHPDVPLILKGNTKGYVLFHNGHLHDWKMRMKDLAIAGGGKIHIPMGHWSDTRAMALMAASCGVGFLEFLNEKLIAFGPEKYEVFEGEANHQKFFKIVDGFWASNRGWESRNQSVDDRLPSQYRGGSVHGHYRDSVCESGNCNLPRSVGSKFCLAHTTNANSLLGCKVGNCKKLRAIRSEYCDDHQDLDKSGKCGMKDCNIPRFQGSPYCPNHKSARERAGGSVDYTCLVPGCKRTVESKVSKAYCQEHLTQESREVAPEVKRFPGSPSETKDGKLVQEKVEGSKEESKEISGQSQFRAATSSLRGARPAGFAAHSLDPVQLDEFKWAQGLNPKDFSMRRRASVPPPYQS